jgi:protein SCO1
MNKLLKTGMLVAILMVPVLVYVFLRTQGNNQYELPVITPEFYDSTSVTKVHRIETVPEFRLLAQDGTYLTREDMEGKIYVADFIFTRCKTICPKMTTQLSRVQENIKGMDNVLILSHTVDPDHDQPEVLQQYADMYGAIPGKWYFLTGTKEEIYSLAKRGYSLPAMKDDGGPEDFLHSEKFMLIDAKGRIRGIYDGTDPEEVDRLIMEIKILLQEPVA